MLVGSQSRFVSCRAGWDLFSNAALNIGDQLEAVEIGIANAYPEADGEAVSSICYAFNHRNQTFKERLCNFLVSSVPRGTSVWGK